MSAEMKQPAAPDLLVRRVRWAMAGAMCGLLVWGLFHLIPTAGAQVGGPGDGPGQQGPCHTVGT